MPPTGTDSPTYTHGASSTEKQQQWRRQHHVSMCPHVYASMCLCVHVCVHVSAACTDPWAQCGHGPYTNIPSLVLPLLSIWGRKGGP